MNGADSSVLSGFPLRAEDFALTLRRSLRFISRSGQQN